MRADEDEAEWWKGDGVYVELAWCCRRVKGLQLGEITGPFRQKDDIAQQGPLNFHGACEEKVTSALHVATIAECDSGTLHLQVSACAARLV
jgi:hypothetical protein